MFGGVERDVLEVFLSLPSFALNGLLLRYGEKFGPGAEQHARKTYPSWRSGAVKPAGKTIERLIELLPPFFTDAQRFDLIRKLQTHHLERRRLCLATTPEQWRNGLAPLIQELFDHRAQSDLPQIVYQKATWLTNGDATIAQKLLRTIDQEEANLRLSYIENEFRRIQLLLENVKNAEPVRHTVELPQGTIFITIQKEQKTLTHKITEVLNRNTAMQNENDDLLPQVRSSGEITKHPTPGSLISKTIENLPKEQQKKVADKVAEATLELGSSAETARQRDHDSARDMGKAIQAAQALDQTVRGDYDTQVLSRAANGMFMFRREADALTLSFRSLAARKIVCLYKLIRSRPNQWLERWLMLKEGT
jgi:hypothetical protein